MQDTQNQIWRVQHMNVQNVFHITRLELTVEDMIPNFSYYHGVWTCTGACCNPVRLQRRLQQLRHMIVLPSAAPVPFGSWDATLVHTSRFAGPPIHLYANLFLSAPPHDRLRVVDLRAGVAADRTVASRAVGYIGLSIRELTGMWAWLRDVKIDMEREQ